MTRVFGILGYPLGHTLSPLMHSAAFSALGLDAVYAPFETPAAQLSRVLAGLDAAGIAGLNVTVPHKERVFRLLGRRVSTEAAAMGAVNTLVRTRHGLMGVNTDVAGFREAVRHDLELPLRGATVVLLGAGGAARAVAWALRGASIRQLVVVNRTPSRLRAFLRWLRAAGGIRRIDAVPWERRRLAACVPQAQLVVNATSLGLHERDLLPVDPEWLNRRMAVADLVYRASSGCGDATRTDRRGKGAAPQRGAESTTALVLAARRRGALAIDGVPMLVYQGAAAFQLWWKQPAPITVMRRAVERAIRRA